jgi:CBS domain-containing protein
LISRSLPNIIYTIESHYRVHFRGMLVQSGDPGLWVPGGLQSKYQSKAPIRRCRGGAMLKVKDIMTTKLITVSPETEILQAAKILLEKRINGIPVVDEAGRLVGILCQSDLIAQQKRLPIPSFFTFMDGLFSISSAKQIEKQVQKIAAITVAQAMTPDPVSVEPDMGIEAVAGLMVDSGLHTIPVLHEGKLVGIVGKEDILKTLIGNPL